MTELGIARRVVAEHGHVRYLPLWKKWLVWDGRRWARDTTGEAHRRAKDTVRRLLRSADEVEDTDEDLAKKIRAAARKAETAYGIGGVLQLAGTEKGIALAPEDLDSHPWLLNVANGVLDLRTGRLRPHDPALHLTKVTAAAYHPDAAAPCFERFLERVQPELSMRVFLARLLGHTLPGVVIEHVLAILHGVGANGKSTLAEVVSDALGDYATAADPDLLIDTGATHPTGVADLFGTRFVTTTETDSGRRLAEATVKRLTGGDRIKARRMREDFWEFIPSHSIVMLTNHRPLVRGDDEGIWRRLRVVPFDVIVPETEQDGHLKDKLREEIDGILTWLVAGCLAWQHTGLDEPERVQEATASYRSDCDTLGAFLDERCLTFTHAHVRSSELFAAWQGWCRTQGVGDTGTQKAFSLAMENRGFTKAKSNGVIRFHGVDLAATGEEQP